MRFASRESAWRFKLTRTILLFRKAQATFGRIWTFFRKRPLKVGARTSRSHYRLRPLNLIRVGAHDVIADTISLIGIPTFRSLSAKVLRAKSDCPPWASKAPSHNKASSAGAASSPRPPARTRCEAHLSDATVAEFGSCARGIGIGAGRKGILMPQPLEANQIRRIASVERRVAIRTHDIINCPAISGAVERGCPPLPP